MSFEDVNRREGRDIGGEIEDAYEQSKVFLDTTRIKIDNFSGLYDPSLLEADQKEVDRLKDIFQRQEQENTPIREAKHASVVLEAAISRNVSQNLWFGGNSSIVHTSEYDDFVNGVDGILRIKETGRDSFLALGVDVTFSGYVEKKIERIRDELARGELAEVKYFDLPSAGFKGRLTDVPRIVLGADFRTVAELAHQQNIGNENVVKKHWLQYQLLEMAIMQCEAFGRFAKRKGFQKAAGIYAQDQHRLEGILNLKKKTASFVPEDRDRVFADVKRSLGLLNS